MTLPKEYVIRFSDNDISLENTRLVMTMLNAPRSIILMFNRGAAAELIFVRNHEFMTYSVNSFAITNQTIINFADWI